MPNVDATNITFNAVSMVTTGGFSISAILPGAAKPAHILMPAGTVRRAVRMSALAAASSNCAQLAVGQRPESARPCAASWRRVTDVAAGRRPA